MPFIPPHIQQMIQDLACRKVHNNTVSKHGLLVCIEVDFDKRIQGDIERIIECWVYDCLDRAHRALDFDYNWYFITNVRHDQWQEDDNMACEDESGLRQRHNGLQVAVHFGAGCYDSYNWPLFHYSKHEVRQTVDPNAVLHHFHTAPTYIRTVGVSGVSEPCLRDEWIEMISTESNTFDRPGKGYMVHPMWILSERTTAEEVGNLNGYVREMSYNFGWDNYPPEGW